jgi:hypothetical protein
MTALLEKVLAQASRLPDAEQDAVAVRLLQTLTEFEREKQQTTVKPRPQLGSAKGMFTLSPDFDESLRDFEKQPPIRKAGTATGTLWMAEDFDAPLEDFKEYM